MYDSGDRTFRCVWNVDHAVDQTREVVAVEKHHARTLIPFKLTKAKSSKSHSLIVHLLFAPK